MDHFCYLCFMFIFVMPCSLVIACWERADLLAPCVLCFLVFCHFPTGLLGQEWYLIVSIPDLCIPIYLYEP